MDNEQAAACLALRRAAWDVVLNDRGGEFLRAAAVLYVLQTTLHAIQLGRADSDAAAVVLFRRDVRSVWQRERAEARAS